MMDRRQQLLDGLVNRLGHIPDEPLYEVEDSDNFHLETETEIRRFFFTECEDDVEKTEQGFNAWLVDCDRAGTVQSFEA